MELAEKLKNIVPENRQNTEEYKELFDDLSFLDHFSKINGSNIITNLKALTKGVYFIDSDRKIEHSAIKRDEITEDILSGTFIVVDTSFDFNDLYLYEFDENITWSFNKEILEKLLEE